MEAVAAPHLTTRTAHLGGAPERTRTSKRDVLSAAGMPNSRHGGMVAVTGVEPARPFGHDDLNAARLPEFRHTASRTYRHR